jgi:hypothetical protein
MSILLTSRRSSIELKEIGINTSPGYARLISEDISMKDELPPACLSNQGQSVPFDEVDTQQRSHQLSSAHNHNINNRDDKPKILVNNEPVAIHFGQNDFKSIKEKQSSAKVLSRILKKKNVLFINLFEI